MRSLKGGVSPCDRRLDRRKVAIAAVAALFLFAASPARADIVAFDIDVTKSFMSFTQEIDASELKAGVHTSVPQFAGSDTTSLFGTLFVDIIPGAIDIGAGGPLSTIEYSIGAPGVGGVPGVYVPHDPITSAPPFPPVGTQSGSNYGVGTGSPLHLAEVLWGIRGYMANLGAIGHVPVDGFGDFAFVPGDDAILGKKGRLAFTSALGSDTGDLIDEPLAAYGTGGVSPGNWSGGVLTLPIESTFTVSLDTGDISPGTEVHVTYFQSGVIVATPQVPEPSTMVLLGCGVVGLLACGWRMRRRKA